MLSVEEYVEYDAIGLADLICKNEVSAAEVLETAIQRAEAINPVINAIVTPMYEQARSQLNASSGSGAGSKLSGVPFLLKDLRASYKGVATSAGHRSMQQVPSFDSDITGLYKGAGLLIFGKTNVPELGMYAHSDNSLFGATRNPWNLAFSAGGSSGGSAAAVAARLAPAAHATDGGGSTRIPASCCGLFGLKTSKGRVSYGPESGEELIGMSTQHACTISVRDSAALLDVVSVPNYGDPYWAPPPPASYLEILDAPMRPLRIAVSSIPPDGEEVHADCEAALRFTVKLCELLGHRVEEAGPAVNWEAGYGAALDAVKCANVAAGVLARYATSGKTPLEEDFVPFNWQLIQYGISIKATEYCGAVKRLHSLGRVMASFHEKYDLLLTPTLPTPPLRPSQFDTSPQNLPNFEKSARRLSAFTRLANITGQPAMTVPLFWNADGLPIGTHFSARFGNEVVLLQLARQLELAAPWAHRRPSMR